MFKQEAILHIYYHLSTNYKFSFEKLIHLYKFSEVYNVEGRGFFKAFSAKLFLTLIFSKGIGDSTTRGDSTT